MSCTRIYDFIRGTEMRLLLPREEEPEWSLLRPGATGLELMRRHQDLLMRRMA